MKFKSQNTAIRRKKPSRPTKFFFEKRAKDLGITSEAWILDFGCGRRDDVEWLGKKGYKTIGWDPYFISSPLYDKTFDIVLCNYVLNVIPETSECLDIIAKAWRHVKFGGYLFVSVRSLKEVLQLAVDGEWIPYNRGWISSYAKATFQAGYNLEQLGDILINTPSYSSEFGKSDNFVWAILRKDPSASPKTDN